MNDKLKRYGNRLQLIRSQMQLTRKQIFLDHGIKEHSIRRWELGEYEIGIVTLEKYLEVFKRYGVNIPLKVFIDLDRPIEKEFKIKKKIRELE